MILSTVVSQCANSTLAKADSLMDRRRANDWCEHQSMAGNGNGGRRVTGSEGGLEVRGGGGYNMKGGDGVDKTNYLLTGGGGGDVSNMLSAGTPGSNKSFANQTSLNNSFNATPLPGSALYNQGLGKCLISTV